MDSKQAERNELGDKIEKFLLNYRLSNLVDEDGYAFPLVDALSQPNTTIATGKEEIEILAGELAWLLIPAE